MHDCKAGIPVALLELLSRNPNIEITVKNGMIVGVRNTEKREDYRYAARK